jgi:hypothetical protein
MFQIGPLFSIRRPFRARLIVIFVLTLNLYCQLGRIYCRFFQIPFQDGPKINYPIWHSFSWFFTAHTIMPVMTAVLHGGMLAMSWGLYALVDWMIISLVTFTDRGGPINYGLGYCWVNAVLLYVFAGYFALHGWRLGFALTAALFAILARAAYWLASEDIFTHVPVKYHWIAVNFRLVIFKPGLPAPANRRRGSGNRGYTCPLSYIWGVVGLQLFKRIPMFDGISVPVAFLGGKIFMLHLFDAHPCVYPMMRLWVSRGTEWMAPYAYIRRLSTMAATGALFGCVLEIIRWPAFDMAEHVLGMSVRAAIGCSACVGRVWRRENQKNAKAPDASS